mmetsp:Transcript_1511/g.2136  ORF Transcript_1511/g.2136 Transcript_1511/m.2136 type:complete len:123 (-) Transcript_1511:95-463(-)
MAFGSSTNYLESETVKIEHAFTFNISDRWDKPLRQAVDAWLDMGYAYAESFRYIAIGVSAYFVMAGVARLVEAARGDSSSQRSKSHYDKPGSSKDKASKDKSSKHKSSKPGSDGAKSEAREE